MLSAIKIRVNRENAKKSTGPKTPEGKAAVSQNSVTHGFRSRRAVLLIENPHEYKELCQTYYEEWQQLVVNKWKLARYEAVESHACMQSTLLHMAFKDPLQYKTEKCTVKFPSLSHKREVVAERSLTRAGQHVARVERSYFRALQFLERLQDRRLKQLPVRRQPVQAAAAPPPAKPKVLTAGASAAASTAAAPQPAAPVLRPVPARHRASGA